MITGGQRKKAEKASIRKGLHFLTLTLTKKGVNILIATPGKKLHTQFYVLTTFHQVGL